ncbi:MAG: hypothetical protein NUW01_17005, partial [Gemmatimonadaceae bacterium]|nr:hypothetical protein [Gemmatimonadaceae bacterium]
VRSQLDALSDSSCKHDGAQLVSGSWTFSDTINLDGTRVVRNVLASQVFGAFKNGDSVETYYAEDTDVAALATDVIQDVNLADGDLVTYRTRVSMWGKAGGTTRAGYYEAIRSFWKDGGVIQPGVLTPIYSELATVGATVTIAQNGNTSVRTEVTAPAGWALEVTAWTEITYQART